MRYDGPRCASTAIYFLLSGGDFSAFHRLKSDEVWHFYAGNGLELFVLDHEGGVTLHHMGNSLDLGQIPQAVARAGSWLAACPVDPTSFALVGCTVAPGFEFNDLELGDRATLIDQFPAHRELITRFTRESSRS
jgi:hypothetical protein